MSASNRDTWADGGAGGLLLRPREMTTIIDPVALHPTVFELLRQES
jgi:hypothetical protein